MKRPISFSVSAEERALIRKIVDRAVSLAIPAGSLDRMTILMDLAACHANNYPLLLEELLAADDFNFAHDVFGIYRHINRTTGELTRCFSPRFLAPQPRPNVREHIARSSR